MCRSTIFPNWPIGSDQLPDRMGKVNWLSVSRGAFQTGPAIQTLQAAIEHATRQWGTPEGREEFIPHVTLARMRSPSRRTGGAFKECAEKMQWDASWPVDRFELIRSRLEAEGAVYETVQSFELN